MKKLILMHLMLFAMFASCNNGEDPIDELNSVGQVIDENFVTKALLDKYLSVTKKKGDVSIITQVKENGYVVAYYVNYKNGASELISADKRCPAVLCELASGNVSFDSFKKNNHQYQGIINLIASIKRGESKNDNTIWEALSKKQKNEGLPLSKRGEGSGMWVALDTVYESDVYYSPRTIETNWGDNTYWNQYTPRDVMSPFPIGCIAISTGQVCYKYRVVNHRNITIPTTVTFTQPIDGLPIFSNYTAGAWSQMAKLSTEPLAKRNVTAAFLSYIGNYAHLTYTNTALGTYGNKAQAESILNLCGINYTSYNYYSAQLAYSNLRTGNPVIAIQGPHNESGLTHMFIIDSYKTETENLVANFVWDPDHRITTDEAYTLEPWRFTGPTGISHDDEYYQEVLYGTKNVSFRMKWGQGNNISDNIYYLALRESTYSFDTSITEYSPMWSDIGTSTTQIIKNLITISNSY